MKQALYHYRQESRLHPGDIDAAFREAFVLVVLRQFRLGAKKFGDVLQLDRQNRAQNDNENTLSKEKRVQCHYIRGHAFEKTGALLDAEQSYKEALSVIPDHQKATEALKRLREGKD